MSQEQRRIIFVGGIPLATSRQEVEAHFEKYGQVAKVSIAYNKKTKQPRGYAYLTMISESAVARVLSATHTLNGRKVDCQIAAKKSEKKAWKDEQRTRRVFLKNIPTSMTVEDLNQAFSVFGQVRTSYKILEKPGLEGCGYVEFCETEAVEKTLKGYSVLQFAGAQISCLPYLAKTQQPISLDDGEAIEATEDASDPSPQKDFFQGAKEGFRKKIIDEVETPTNQDCSSKNNKFAFDKEVQPESDEQSSFTENSPSKIISKSTNSEKLVHSPENLRFNLSTCVYKSVYTAQKIARQRLFSGPSYYRLF